ncbi:hypothetical protein PHYBOEH_001975 [Phytophthora boehmeriae]|uniref:WLGC domain-containing protein n=1 Tax=Phytophthora boehmeriae TaxID=109152 RepID=A0A8T1WRG1_9STRA|nr:hypothetical protein PHYBOEH_001975 [Phytophthora boehmeriae]
MVFSKGWKVAQDPTAKTATATGELDVKRNPIDAQSEIAEFDSWWKWRRRRSASIGWGNLMLMTLIFLLSSLWSALLIFLNLEPNQSANYILQTASLDHGHFWQSRLAPSSVQAASASLLLVVIGVYCHLLYLLHVRRPPRRVLSDELKSKGPKTILRKMTTKVDKLTASERMQRLPRVIVRKVLRTIAKFYRDVVSTEGKYRKVWNVLMEIPEIILQILSLQEYMMQGLDSSLLYFYAALMATNAFLAFYHIQFKWNEDTLHHILKDSIVDAIFAVFFPALILFYSFSVFQGDLKAVKIRQKVLIHTGVEVFPSWVSTTFSNMDYLHIEGDTSSTNLVELPNDFFNSMSKIHTIHLSYLSNLSSLPPLVGLTALESVYFGYLDSIKELPSMEGLSSIQVIAMESLPQVRSLPEIASYQDTLEMVFIQDMPACCSGFLSDGTCNTTFLNCCQEESLQDQSSSSSFNTDSSSSPTCLRLPGDSNLLPTNASLAILNQFAANVSNFCDSAQASCPYILASHLLKSMDICDGVLYRECTSEANGVGICFNQDMGPVQCVHSQSTVDMREAEIAAGCECDVVEEQWLGCT